MRINSSFKYWADASSLLYAVLAALSFVLFAASIHFLTIEPDEAWNLLSVGQLLGGPFSGSGILKVPVVSSGGVYALIHYALLRADLPIEAHRLVSTLFCALTLVMVYALAKAKWGSARSGLIAAAVFVTVPGFLLQTGLAWAEIISTFLLIAGAWHWSARGSASLAGSVVSGALFGLCAATRMSALIALPAIVIWSLLYARTVPRALLHAIVACALASAIFLLSIGVYYFLFRMNNLHTFANDLVTVFSEHNGKTVILSYFVTSESLFPASMMIVAAVALIPSPQTRSFGSIRPLCTLLLLIGVIGWAAWIVNAPIPHVRYLWPALPALWLCQALLLLGWLMTLETGHARLLLHAAIISVWATQFAVSLRQVAYGDSLTLVYEANRRAPIVGWFTPFHARRDQNEIASVVTRLRPDAQVYAPMEEAAYPITWLTGRRVRSFSQISESSRSEGDRYLIVFPSDKNIWPLTLTTLDWIKANATLHSRFGDYSVYRIKVDVPDPDPINNN